MSKIEISDVPKAVLIAALVNSAVAHRRAGPRTMSLEQAEELVASGRLNLGWEMGRSVNVDLSDSSVDPYGYDRDNGDGAFQAVLDEVRTSISKVPKGVQTAYVAIDPAVDLTNVWTSVFGAADSHGMELFVQRPANGDLTHLHIGIAEERVNELQEELSRRLTDEVFVEVDEVPVHGYPDHLKMYIVVRDAEIHNADGGMAAFSDPRVRSGLEMETAPSSLRDVHFQSMFDPHQMLVISITSLDQEHLQIAQQNSKPWKIRSRILNEGVTLYQMDESISATTNNDTLGFQ